MPVALKGEERETLLLVEGAQFRRTARRGILFATMIENHDRIRPRPIRSPVASMELILSGLNRDFLRRVGGRRRPGDEEKQRTEQAR